MVILRPARTVIMLGAVVGLAMPACSTPIVGTDAGPPDAPSMIDSGPGPLDTGPDVSVGIDGGPIAIDTGPIDVDGGPTGVDGGPIGADTGPTGTDSGPSGTDAGPAGLDGGPGGIDAGPSGVDAGPGVDGGAGPCGGLPFGTFYRDLDGDGHGAVASGTSMRCAAGAGFVASNDDCNDASATIYAGATEACNGADDNCNVTIDDIAPSACPFANGVGACTGGTCTLASCTAPFDDCDAVPGNGCEADTRVTAAHCGACGSACGAADTCSSSSCDGSAIAEVALGYDLACVRRANGRVACWGVSGNLALGSSVLTDPSPPVEVPGITDAIDIDVGGRGACAVRATGQVWCWGLNAAGELGERRDVPRVGLPPGPVAGITDAVQVVLHDVVACARRTSGRVVCWGRGSDGALDPGGLGDGGVATGDFVPPTAVVGLIDAADIVEASRTGTVTCARRTGGSVLCWGGQITGCYGDRPVWPTTTPAVTGATLIASGMYGTVCWAAGAGAVTCQEPVACSMGFPYPSTAPSDVTSIAAGYDFGCVSHRTGGVSCWGYNSTGQLGRGTTLTGPFLAPAPVVGLGPTRALAASDFFACAVSTTSAVRCWGRNYGAFVGTGVTESSTPLLIPGL